MRGVVALALAVVVGAAAVGLAVRGATSTVPAAPAPSAPQDQPPAVAPAVDDAPAGGAGAAVPPIPVAAAPGPQIRPYGPRAGDPRPAATAPGACMVQGPDGAIDLAPELRRIESAVRGGQLLGDLYDNGARRLPVRPAGHYRSYRLQGAGMAVAGGVAQAVFGSDGEVYYSPDGDRLFKRVPWPPQPR
ncbi:MAG: hypothetical protein AAF628_09385 [Planctomycetota bacterium]